MFSTSTRHAEAAVRRDRLRAELQVGKPEAGVAEAVAEREEGFPRDVQVLRRIAVIGLRRPAGVQVVVVEGHLADGAREGDGQLAAGVHVAEEDVGDGVAPLGAGEPGLEDRGHVLGDPADGRAAGRSSARRPWACRSREPPSPGRAGGRAGRASCATPASPLMLDDSPTATIATSDWRARRTASAKPSVDPPSISQPLAWATCTPGRSAALALIPARSVTTSADPAVAPPVAERGVRGRRPGGRGRRSIGARASSGSTSPSFLSRTIERAGDLAGGGLVLRRRRAPLASRASSA